MEGSQIYQTTSTRFKVKISKTVIWNSWMNVKIYVHLRNFHLFLKIQKRKRERPIPGEAPLRFLRKVKRKKAKHDEHFEDVVIATNIVHAAKGNIRSYILGKLGGSGQKKFLVEISQGQSENHQALIQSLADDLQGHLGRPLQAVKTLARQKKQEILS